jgi:hypothetical protein
MLWLMRSTQVTHASDETYPLSVVCKDSGFLFFPRRSSCCWPKEETSSPESADTGRSGNNLKRRSLGSHHCGSAYPWRKNAGTSSIASTPYLAGVSGQLPTRSVRSWDFHPAPWPVARSVLVVALALNGLGVSLRTREDGWTAPVDPTPTILRSSSPPTTFTSSTLTFRVLLIRSETQGIDLYERISRSSPAYLDTC